MALWPFANDTRCVSIFLHAQNTDFLFQMAHTHTHTMCEWKEARSSRVCEKEHK